MTTLYKDDLLAATPESSIMAQPSSLGLAATPEAPAAPTAGLLGNAPEAPAGIGLAPAAPTAPDGASATMQSEEPDLMSRVGRGLQRFSAGMTGDLPVYEKQRLAKIAETKEIITALEHGIDMRRGLEGDAAKNFDEMYGGQLDKLMPGMKQTFMALADKPSLLKQFDAYVNYLPEPMKILAQNNPKQFLAYVGTADGQKMLVNAKDQFDMRVASKKVQATKIGIQQYLPKDVVDRINADGVVTTSDIIDSQRFLPKELQLSDNEMQAIQRNDKTFWQGLGVLHGDKEQDVLRNRASSKDKPPTRTTAVMQGGIRMEKQEEWKNGKWMQVGDLVPHFKPDSETGGANAVPAELADLHGDDYLAKVTPGERALIKRIAEGSEDPKNLSTRGGHRERLLAMTSQYDPSFDSSNYSTRAATRRDFAAGPTSKNVTSLNTAIGHLGTMSELSDKLGNGDVPAINYIANKLNVAIGKDDVTNFEVVKTAVADEMMRVFRGVGASQTEAEDWKKKFLSSGSPTQIKGAIATGADLLGSRIESINDQWKRGMSTEKNFPKLLSPKSRETFQKVGGKLDRYLRDDNAVAATPAVNDKGWKLMVDGNGNRAYVGPNNEIEPVK